MVMGCLVSSQVSYKLAGFVLFPFFVSLFLSLFISFHILDPAFLLLLRVNGAVLRE